MNCAFFFHSISVASAKKQAAEEAKTSRTTKTAPTEPAAAAAPPARKSTSGVSPKAKVKRKSQKMSHLAKKKKKLYCICQTPYDDSKYDFHYFAHPFFNHSTKRFLIILKVLCWLRSVQQLVSW